MNLTPTPRLLFFAIVVSWAIALLTGPMIINVLKKIGAGARVRRDGPQTHLVKDGTPIMGGFIFLISSVVTTLIFASREPQPWTEVLTVMGVALASGAVGWLDDATKTIWRNPHGIRAREKLLAQVAITAGLGYMAVGVLGLPTTVQIPFTSVVWDLGIWYYPFLFVLVAGITNAVNFTDGVDGLLATQSLVVFLFYAMVAVVTRQWNLAIFAVAVGGGAVGFLQYNRHPARVFMGDTGSFFLGGALAALAVLTKTELLLPLAGGLFVAEMLSVILQVASFKLTGKRIFRMSPLHHHFDLGGWSENRIVRTFLAVTLVCLVMAWFGMPKV
jgi:phospho-N-acetylmuramoyl-pentapeptide-transferase